MIFLKSTATTLTEGVFQIDIAAKPPGKTFDVIVALDADNLPQGFIDKIEGLGFKRGKTATYKHGDGKKVLDLVFQKPGTDIFQGWTDAEREVNLQQLEAMLADYSIEVAPRVMTLAEAYQ